MAKALTITAGRDTVHSYFALRTVEIKPDAVLVLGDTNSCLSDNFAVTGDYRLAVSSNKSEWRRM